MKRVTHYTHVDMNIIPTVIYRKHIPFERSIVIIYDIISLRATYVYVGTFRRLRLSLRLRHCRRCTYKRFDVARLSKANQWRLFVWGILCIPVSMSMTNVRHVQHGTK